MSGPERSLPPSLLSADCAGILLLNVNNTRKLIWSYINELRGETFISTKGPAWLDSFLASLSFNKYGKTSQSKYFPYPVGRTVSKNLFASTNAPKNNLFCLQKKVIVTIRKQRSLHATHKLRRHFEARIFSLPQIVFHHPVDKI